MSEESQTYQFVTRGDLDVKSDVELSKLDLWDGLKERTTAHGIPHITQARGRFKKTFWSIIVTATLGALVYNTISIFMDFFRFDVNVVIEIRHEPELEFPAVTICNLNPIRKSALDGSQDLQNVLNKNSSATTTSSRRRRRKRSATGSTTVTPTNTGTYDASQDKCCCSCCSCAAPTTTAAPPITTTPFTGTTTTRAPPVVSYPDPDDQTAVDPEKPKVSVTQRDTTESFKVQEQVSTVLANMPVSTKSPLGYYKEDFIISCSYAGHSCYPSDFSSFYNSKYGNCFIFNSGWNKSYAIEKSFKPGPQYGLKLVLNIQQDEYVGELGEAAGARVVIHYHDKMPFPEDEGFSVGPGLLTSAGISQVTIERIGGRHGECVSTAERSISRNVFEEYYPVKYTNTACLKTCYQKELIMVCKCADPQFPMKGVAFNNVNVSACDTTDKEQTKCVEGVTEKFSNNTLECDCKMPCIEKVYVPVVSSVLWPSEDHKESLFKELSSASQYAKAIIDNADPEKYKTNFLKLEVYFQEFNYEIIKQKPAYEEGAFLSDIGGVIGLWIGCSILSLFEFLEFFMDLTVLLALKCSKRGKSSTKIQLIDVQPSGNPNQQSNTNAQDQKLKAEQLVPPDILYNKPNNIVIANSISKKMDNFNAEQQQQTQNYTKPVETKSWEEDWNTATRHTKPNSVTPGEGVTFKQVSDNTMIVRKVFMPAASRPVSQQQFRNTAHDKAKAEASPKPVMRQDKKPLSETKRKESDQDKKEDRPSPNATSKGEQSVLEIAKTKTKLRKKLKKKRVDEASNISNKQDTDDEILTKQGDESKFQSDEELLDGEPKSSLAEANVAFANERQHPLERKKAKSAQSIQLRDDPKRATGSAGDQRKRPKKSVSENDMPIIKTDANGKWTSSFANDGLDF